MFAKDILVIDFETNSNNPRNTEPTQIGALLLDKGTLEEKQTFVSYISANLENADPAALAVAGITPKDLEGAPSSAEVGKKFFDAFGSNILLASWNEHLDRRMLIKILTDAHIDYLQYDYHYLDLWPVAYVHMLKHGFIGELNSDTAFEWFGLGKRDQHDALGDCRMAAEVLRKILASKD